MMDIHTELPNYTETMEFGEKGSRMVADAVEDELHWIFRPIVKSDLGIDGEIEYITKDKKGSGKLIAAQIKCGPSYFQEKTGKGYVFRCTAKNVKYWLSLSIPVILCLCDNVDHKIYWCHITVETVQKLEKGYKVEVPYENLLDGKNKYKLKRVLESVVPIQSIVDASIFIYLHERFKERVKICPLIEEPRDFHGLSYIIELKDKLYMVGTVIDRYGYFEQEELLEKIRLYQENCRLCGWEQNATEAAFMLFFVSESAKNLKLQDSIINLLNCHEEIIYERLLLRKEYILATLVTEVGDAVYMYDENGDAEFTGHNVWNDIHFD